MQPYGMVVWFRDKWTGFCMMVRTHDLPTQIHQHQIFGSKNKQLANVKQKEAIYSLPVQDILDGRRRTKQAPYKLFEQVVLARGEGPKKKLTHLHDLRTNAKQYLSLNLPRLMNGAITHSRYPAHIVCLFMLLTGLSVVFLL
jgi:hypothetical protein